MGGSPPAAFHPARKAVRTMANRAAYDYKAYIQIGLNILRYRKEQGLTQEQLADMTGHSRNHIQRAYTAPTVATLLDISAAGDAIRNGDHRGAVVLSICLSMRRERLSAWRGRLPRRFAGRHPFIRASISSRWPAIYAS